MNTFRGSSRSSRASLRCKRLFSLSNPHRRHFDSNARIREAAESCFKAVETAKVLDSNSLIALVVKDRQQATRKVSCKQAHGRLKLLL